MEDRALHAALDASREAEKKARAANMKVRNARQRARRVKLEKSICARLKLEELLEMLAQPNHSDEATEGKAHQRALSAVAAVLKLFAKERRNDFSPEAVAAFLNTPLFTPEIVAELVDALKASGDYKRILSEVRASPRRRHGLVNSLSDR